MFSPVCHSYAADFSAGATNPLFAPPDLTHIKNPFIKSIHWSNFSAAALLIMLFSLTFFLVCSVLFYIFNPSALLVFGCSPKHSYLGIRPTEFSRTYSWSDEPSLVLSMWAAEGQWFNEEFAYRWQCIPIFCNSCLVFLKKNFFLDSNLCTNQLLQWLVENYVEVGAKKILLRDPTVTFSHSVYLLHCKCEPMGTSAVCGWRSICMTVADPFVL